MQPLMRLFDFCTHIWLQEYVNGQLKNKYGDAFIRGNNGECTAVGGSPSRAMKQNRS